MKGQEQAQMMRGFESRHRGVANKAGDAAVDEIQRSIGRGGEQGAVVVAGPTAHPALRAVWAAIVGGGDVIGDSSIARDGSIVGGISGGDGGGEGCAAACRVLVVLVQRGVLPWHGVVAALLDAAPSVSTSVSASSSLVDAVVALLRQCRCCVSPNTANTNACLFGAQSHPQSSKQQQQLQLQNPLVALCSIPALASLAWPATLCLVDDLFRSLTDSPACAPCVIRLVRPFAASVFFPTTSNAQTNEPYPAVAVANFASILADGAKVHPELARLLLFILRNSPRSTLSANLHLVSMLNSLANVIVDEKTTPITADIQISTFFLTLSVCLDSYSKSRNRFAIVFPLRILHKISLVLFNPANTTLESQIHLIRVTVISICVLLLESCDVDTECFLSLSILDSVFSFLSEIFETKKSVFTRNVISCCIYPLTCLVSELPSNSYSSYSLDVTHLAASLLQKIDTFLLNSLSTDSALEDLNTATLTLGEFDFLCFDEVGEVLHEIIKFYNSWNGRNLDEKYSIASSNTLAHNLLLSSFLFHPVESTRLDTLALFETILSTPSLPRKLLNEAKRENTAAKISQTTPQSQLALQLLPVFLRILNKDPSPNVKAKILQSTIPAVVTDHNDAFVTTSVMRLIISLLAPLNSTGMSGPTQQPVLCAMAVRLLFSVWKVQPRVWPQLKGVLSSWVGRKRNRSIALQRFRKRGDAVVDGEIDLEVAVVSTICDVCTLKAKDCGQDMLPLALAMLELTGETLLATKVLALETINLCISAEITDPRAIWNVHHGGYINQLLVSDNSNVAEEIWIKICEFYALVPKMADDTEVYQTFKLEIASKYLLPMLNLNPNPQDPDSSLEQKQQQKNQKEFKYNATIRSAAYKACAFFSPPDLYPLIATAPEVLSVLTEEISSWSTDGNATSGDDGCGDRDGVSSFITRITSYEIENMRRAVYKAIATDVGVGKFALRDSDTDAVGAGKSSNDEGAVELLKTRKTLLQYGGDIREKWCLGKAAAAVRPGFAALSLFLSSNFLPEEAKGDIVNVNITGSLARLPLYKDLVNGLRDINVTDHLLIRIESVAVWISFWTCRFQLFAAIKTVDETPVTRLERVEWLFKVGIAELEKRLWDAKQPVICANTVCCIAGLICTAVMMGLPSAPENVNRIVKILIEQFGRSFDSSAILSDLQKSDEVQFAVSLALSYFTQLLFPTDEASFGLIIQQLKSEVQNQKSDTAQSAFGSSFGLTIVLQSLLQSPSPIVPFIESILEIITSSISNPDSSSATAIVGFAFGLSKILRDLKEFLASSNGDGGINANQIKLSELIKNCFSRFTEFVLAGGDDGEKISEKNLAVAIADCWIVSAGASVSGYFEDVEEVVAGIEILIERAVSNQNLSSCLIHARTSLNFIKITQLSSAAISDTLTNALTLLKNINLSHANKVSLCFSIAPLLGVDTQAPALLSPIAVKRTIETLSSIQLSQDPKVSRSVGWVIGKIIASFEKTYDFENAAIIDLGSLTAADSFSQSRRKDPSDLRRLNEGSSFLRAVFDALNQICIETGAGYLLSDKNIAIAKVLLKGLVDVGLLGKKNALGLPLVNWTKILTVCSESRDPDLSHLCFLLSSVHSSATSAKSLVDYFVLKLKAFDTDSSEFRSKFLFGSDGVGKLLNLVGMYPAPVSSNGAADDAQTAVSITVAPSKVLEIVQAMVYFVYYEGMASNVSDQIKLAESLFDALSQPDLGFPESILKLKADISSCLCDAFLAVPAPVSEERVIGIRRLIRAALVSETSSSISLLQHILAPEEWCSKFVWGLLCIMEFEDDPASFILVHLKKRFISKELLYVRILQFVVAYDNNEAVEPTSCLTATMTYLQKVICKKQQVFVKSSLSAKIAFELQWVVQYLDVLIIACASNNGIGVDFAWLKGLTGALLLLDAENYLHVLGGELVAIHQAEWDVLEKLAIVRLVELLAVKIDNNDVSILRSQIVKRLLRVLECTAVDSNKLQKGQVLTSRKTQKEIRNVLLRARDFEIDVPIPINF